MKLLWRISNGVEKYKVSIKPSAVKELEAISGKKQWQLIIKRIGQLANNPRPPGCTKLSGYDRYRIRQGSYRIVYGIEDNELVVYVVKVAHRKEVYRWLTYCYVEAIEILSLYVEFIKWIKSVGGI